MTHASTKARAEILERLRRQADQSRVGAPPIPTPVTHAAGDRRSLAAMFGAKLAEVGGSCDIIERTAEVSERVRRQIEQWLDALGPAQAAGGGAPQRAVVLSWAPDRLSIPDLEEHLTQAGVSLLVPPDLHEGSCRARAASAAIGLTGVEAAFASTGSVVLASGPDASRSVSLLPLHCLMLIPMSSIYPTFEVWLRTLRGEGRLEEFLRESAQITFVTGPSKSADIELNLTLGVHGPGVVHALVFDDAR